MEYDMKGMSSSLLVSLRRFYGAFGDVVPLRELPASVTEEQLVSAINESIEAGENRLPKLLGYESSKDPSVLM